MDTIRYALDQNLSKWENTIFLYRKARETRCSVYGYYKGSSTTGNIVLRVDFSSKKYTRDTKNYE